MNDLRVLIVADDPLVRAGLATMLADQPGCVAVGQTGGDADLLAEAAVHRPDVVVWDLGWGEGALDETSLERLTDLQETYQVVALLSDEPQATAAWRAGFRNLLLRDADAERLVMALMAVAQGLIALDPALVTSLISARSPAQTPLAEELTPREFEVLQLLAEGLANKAIALQLGISEHTVKFHVNAILAKLGAQSRTQAVVRATRLGLIIL